MFWKKKRKKVEAMSYTKEHEFDEAVIDRIKYYIKENMLSLSMIAEKAGMTYNQMYQLLHKNQLIKLREYVKICRALGVDLELFLSDVVVAHASSGEDYFKPF